MIGTWVAQRYVRFCLSSGVLIAGFASAEVLLRQSSFAVAMEIFPIGLAALVGASKLASP